MPRTIRVRVRTTVKVRRTVTVRRTIAAHSVPVLCGGYVDADEMETLDALIERIESTPYDQEIGISADTWRSLTIYEREQVDQQIRARGLLKRLV